MNRISRIILFFCGLFSYFSLIQPVAAANNTSSTNSTAGKTWHVCVAGYDQYRYTYGFEAGVHKFCSQLVGSNKENVIIISPDKAAFDARNVIPGVLVHGQRYIANKNSPPNVYAGANVTYNSKDVTKRLFYAILSGDKNAAKRLGGDKVLESGPQDTIILYFINIGDYGVMTLTNRMKDLLFAEEFIPFIEDLKERKKFKKMLILMDGQNSGSMFDGYICEDCNILVMTNGGTKDDLELCGGSSESSAFTSTCYSYFLLNYLETLKEPDFKRLTIFDAFQEVRRRPKRWWLDSVSNLYGQLDMGNLLLKEFFTFNK